MLTNTQKIGIVLGVCGAAAGLAGAQPFAVNGSGATLLEALFRAPANTLDFIDVDGDGIVQEQLAPFDASFPFNPNQFWQFNYRVVGSGNGFAELRDWGTLYATAPDLDPSNLTLSSGRADAAYLNTQQYIAATVPQGAANPNNPGAYPFRTLTDGSYAITVGSGAGTGVQIDFNALDVPVSWFLITSGSPGFNRVPGGSGYGDNPRVPTDAAGNPVAFSNKLRSLVSPNGLTLNTNVSNPDDLTVYDTAITLTPVAVMVNYGVGLQEMDVSDIRHLFVAGRRANGENLMAITRDAGSGTRNAFANAAAHDPSWSVGENIGLQTNSSANDRVGAAFQPSNKGGSSRMEATVLNHRLAIGYSGAERGQSSGWLVNGRCEVLGVRADVRGGTVFARPTIENIVDGGVDAYTIVGVGGIATIGDPLSAPASAGGWGWDPSEVGANPNPIQPMRNVSAAAYVNNITRSITAVSTVPSDPANAFSPGEFLGSQFVLPATTFNVIQVTPNPNADFIPIVPNPNRNDVLTQFVLNDPNNVLALPQYASFNDAIAGVAPARTTGVVYSDGGDGSSYLAIDGVTTIPYGVQMSSLRNKIAGDFDGDGARTAGDVADMVAAWGFRHAGGSWNGGSVAPSLSACPEILGDFNGDGNFDAADLRYWADGLHMVNGMLDRKAGFTAVDNAFGGNFFGTTLATGSYQAGASRADVAGNLTTRGYNPVGHDGVVDADDIDYVCANFGDWSDLTQAAGIDLSADMNGDLVVNADDVAEIVESILGTEFGDVNLDGVVDGADLAIAEANLGQAGGWADGDMNCDGIVDAEDIAIITGGEDCLADFNNDGNVNFFDVSGFIDAYNNQDPAADIAAPFGVWNFFDISAFIAAFNKGCP
jgi:hypothetical protein